MQKQSCEDHAFVLSSVLRNRMLEQKSTYISFIDFEKAFDCIDRDMLMYKLISYNVDGKFYKAIRAMYNNTRAIVKVNQMFSSWFDTRFGVRQGDTLSPTLFNIFLNDLVTDIKNLHCRIETDEFSLSVLCYADDIVIITENGDNMQIVLDYIAVWCRKWRMKVNTKKRRLCMYAGNHVNLHKPFLISSRRHRR